MSTQLGVVPRVIHRIWVGGSIPDEYAAYGETWERHHPDWSMRLWTDENLPALRNQELYDQAPSYVPEWGLGQFRADILRYEILYEHGGLYVDADFECLKPVEPLIDAVECFAAWEVDGTQIANGFMGSIPGHVFIDRLIRNLPASARGRIGQRPSRVSGPKYLTQQWHQQSDMMVIPSRFVYPYLWSDLGTPKAEPPWPEECYAVHHWNNQRRARALGERR